MVSDAEEQKCLDLAGNATAQNIRGKLLCVRANSPNDCMLRIKVRDGRHGGLGGRAGMFTSGVEKSVRMILSHLKETIAVDQLIDWSST